MVLIIQFVSIEINVLCLNIPFVCVRANNLSAKDGNILSDYSDACVYKHRCCFVPPLMSVNMPVSAEDYGSLSSACVVCFPSPALVSGGREPSL